MNLQQINFIFAEAGNFQLLSAKFFITMYCIDRNKI